MYNYTLLLALDNMSLTFGDVVADIPGVKNGGLGFFLYVRDGYLHKLEGYTYGEDWPSNVSNFRLSYAPTLTVCT